MANDIKGITVKIGADTTDLSKAMSSANRSISTTQKQLNEVQKALKLDPSNTELLAQKYRLLTEKADETRKKLQTLKDAQSQVEEQYRNGEIDQGKYDAFRIELITTENQLKELEKDVARSNVTINSFGEKMKETGGTILEKPDRLKTAVKNMDMLSPIDEFKKQVDTYITGIYNKHNHNGEGMNGRSPDEVFASNLIEQRILPKDKADLMFMRYAKSNTGTLKVGKNGISLKFYGQEIQYWNEELWRLYFGREVYVRYAPDDLSSIRVYDTEKRFICTADLRGAVSYRADKEAIKELTREKRSAVKAVTAYKKNNAIEEKKALELMLDEAERRNEIAETFNPDIISPIFAPNEQPELLKASGNENTVIDLGVMAERLRRAKEE